MKGFDKQHDISIDILKFLAAIIITFSHMEFQLADYHYLATGGSFGDCLFFFCSGYTLFLSNKGVSFLNWYKKRINRIYPTVFAWALISYLLFSVEWNIGVILTKSGGFFVSCIMIFYILLYPIKHFLQDHLYTIMLFVFMVLSVAYSFLDHSNNNIMYCWKWSMYFIPMLYGAILGKAQKLGKLVKIKSRSCIFNAISLLLSASIYYILMFLISRYSTLHYLNTLLILPQLGVTYCFYALCNSNYAERAYNNKYLNHFMMWIGGMCLEIYIVQPRLLYSFYMTEIFPFNIIVMFALVFVCAFALKVVSRIWAQTFNEADYNWKNIIKLY